MDVILFEKESKVKRKKFVGVKRKMECTYCVLLTPMAKKSNGNEKAILEEKTVKRKKRETEKRKKKRVSVESVEEI